MGKGEFLAVECALVGLYLRGSPRVGHVRRIRWGLVRDVLCRTAPGIGQVAQELKKAGLWDEASALTEPTVLDWALERVTSGRATTVMSCSYPVRWLQTLGHSAPPCFWTLGQPHFERSLSVVGNRVLDETDEEFAKACGSTAMSVGCTLVTGGAIGADRMAIRGALDSGAVGRIVSVVPFGIDRCDLSKDLAWVSVTEPNAPFTAAAAMERNALIYASSPMAVVVRCREQSGGTWVGAIDALRRRLTSLAVRNVTGDAGSQALLKLGRSSESRVLEVPSAADCVTGLESLTDARQAHSGGPSSRHFATCHVCHEDQSMIREPQGMAWLHPSYDQCLAFDRVGLTGLDRAG